MYAEWHSLMLLNVELINSVLVFAGLRGYALYHKIWTSVLVVCLGLVDPVTTLVRDILVFSERGY